MAQQCYDIVVAGDFRKTPCRPTTISDQLTALAVTNYRLGLLQFISPLLDRSETILESIRELVEDGKIAYLDPQQTLTTKLLIITDPRLFTYRPRRMLRLTAESQVLMVPDSLWSSNKSTVTDWEAIYRNATDFLGDSAIWAPMSPMARERLEATQLRQLLAKTNWHSCIDPANWHADRANLSHDKPTIGGVLSSQEDLISDQDILLPLHPDDARFSVKIFDKKSKLVKKIDRIPNNWEISSADLTDEREFLLSIDFFIYFRHPSEDTPINEWILKAMASGAIPVLPPAYEKIFGDAALYASPENVGIEILELYADRMRYESVREAATRCVVERFGPSNFLGHIDNLIGSANPRNDLSIAHRPDVLKTVQRNPRRVLFITINGVGMGHLTRMLAIARRCPEPIEPVFLTMSQALKVLRQQGYLAEFIPSRKYLDCDTSRWNSYLAEEIGEMISFYNPASVVFDGNVPYQGVIEAIKANPDPLYVWSRRGMWRSGNVDIIKRERYFDVVLEPGDLADVDDHGITKNNRQRTHLVRPIRLLDASEMLSREEARSELGLSQDRTTVLIQLGAGNNFDYQNIHKIAFKHLTERYGAQIALGEWLISDKPVDLPDSVVRMPGYPFARYFNAFDLAVSAVGYNSFHELLYAGIPTILVPNEATEQDNQLARAVYADRHSLAICVRAKEVYRLTAAIDQLLQSGEQERVKSNLLALDPTNGATEAARFINELVYSHRVDRS